MTDKYAVVGYPISHSKSPLIHRLFAEQTGEDLIYEAILIDADEQPFDQAMKTLIQLGYKGFNVTVPYKLSAYEFATAHTPRAQTAQAVNTLIVEQDGKILGDNTDGVGLVLDIEQLAGFSLKGKSILILGAGGAVQGVMQNLLDATPREVHIANRTATRAEALAKRFQGTTPITASSFEAVPKKSFDVIINGTAASLENKVPPVSPKVIGAQTLVYDMMYQSEPTVFLKWAKQHQPSCETRDGLGMLICQAAEAFYLWRGIKPSGAPILNQVRETLST